MHSGAQAKQFDSQLSDWKVESNVMPKGTSSHSFLSEPDSPESELVGRASSVPFSQLNEPSPQLVKCVLPRQTGKKEPGFFWVFWIFVKLGSVTLQILQHHVPDENTAQFSGDILHHKNHSNKVLLV